MGSDSAIVGTDSGKSTKVPTINRNSRPRSIGITAHDQTEWVPTMPRNTQLIANMLGVRRESVSVVAGKLQEMGLIDYRRGRITVIDRLGLEERACECYAVVKKETDRLLSDTCLP